MPFNIFSFPLVKSFIAIFSEMLNFQLWWSCSLGPILATHLWKRESRCRTPGLHHLPYTEKMRWVHLFLQNIRQFNICFQLNLFEPGNTFAKNNFACWVWPWWKTRFTNLWHLMETCTLDLLPKLPLNILARAWPPKFISSSWYKVIVRIHFPRFLCL